MDFTTISSAAALILAVVVGLSNVFTLRNHVANAKKPMVEDHEMLMEHDRKLNKDHERLNDLKEGSDKQAKLLLQMANHVLDGNHVDKLTQARDELQNYLISR